MEPPKHVAQRTRWEKDDDGLVLHIQRFIQTGLADPGGIPECGSGRNIFYYW